MVSTSVLQERTAYERRLLWLMGSRLAISTLLMGATVAYQLRRYSSDLYPTENFVFWLVGATYFLTLVYSFLLPRLPTLQHLRSLAGVQIVGDLFLVSLLVLATGCQDSLFLFLYILVILEASMILARKTAFFFSFISLLMLALLLTVSLQGWLRTISFIRRPSVLEVYDFIYVLLVYGSAFFAVALLASHLAEQLRSSGALIKEKQSHLEALLTQHDDLRTLHRDIIMSLSSGLITTDLQGRIQFANPMAWEILGLSISLPQSLKIEELFFGLPWQDFQESVKKSPRLEQSYLHPDGGRRILGMSCSPLRDREERLIGWLVLFQDLSPIKQMEEMAKNRERMAVIGEMAAGLAHEIRNPLASLSGAIQMLQEELSLSQDHQLLMDIALRETERLNTLLTDFLSFARPKNVQSERYVLIELVREVTFLFLQDERFQRIEVSLSIPEDCMVWLDATLFGQVMWNLLLNAGQAILPDTGKIELSALCEQEGVWVSVTDSGHGIKESIRERLFDPFFSTKAGGTGLGLSVVQRILHAHHGKVEVFSPERGGTCFRLFFPNRVEGRAEEFEVEKELFRVAERVEEAKRAKSA